MSKLNIAQRIPDTYDKARFADIFREIENQANQLAEGKAASKYSSRTAVPSGSDEAFAVSDLLFDSNATVTNGSVRLGWICVAPGSPGTQQEVWVGTAAFPTAMSAFANLAASTTAPSASDYLAIGSAADTVANKVTWTNAFKVIGNLGTDASPDPAADYLLTLDATDGLPKKALISSVSSGGISTIASGNLSSGTSVTIANIPATYSYLILKLTGISSDTATRLPLIRVDTDNGASFDATAANYDGWRTETTGIAATTLASLAMCDAQAAATTIDITVYIYAYQGGPFMEFRSRSRPSSGTQYHTYGQYIGSTSAINALQVIWNGTGNFDGAGTYALYGVK